MGRIDDRLANHAVVGIDTPVFIYHVESHPDYAALTREVLSAIQAGECAAVTSVITLMEMTIHPWRAGRGAAARQYESLLVHFPNLEMVAVDRHIARRAAQLRASHNLRPADALQAATALLHNASALITNDKNLTRTGDLLEVVILDDFVRDRRRA